VNKRRKEYFQKPMGRGKCEITRRIKDKRKKKKPVREREAVHCFGRGETAFRR